MTKEIIFKSVIVESALMTSDPSDMICENTRYSVMRIEAIYIFIVVIMSVDVGRRNSQGVAASRSGPQIFEYHKGTYGGSNFHVNTILINPRSAPIIAMYVANETILFVDNLFHLPLISPTPCLIDVFSGGIRYFEFFIRGSSYSIEYVPSLCTTNVRDGYPGNFETTCCGSRTASPINQGNVAFVGL